jgi:hypothetical protein
VWWRQGRDSRRLAPALLPGSKVLPGGLAGPFVGRSAGWLRATPTPAPQGAFDYLSGEVTPIAVVTVHGALTDAGRLECAARV